MTSIVMGLALLAAAQQPAAPRVTFTETIAPILYANCVTCHRPGEAAPFSLITYEEAKMRATLIAQSRRSRATCRRGTSASGYGEFVGERRLTDAQIAAFDQWVKQGTPQRRRGEDAHAADIRRRLAARHARSRPRDAGRIRPAGERSRRLSATS